MSFDTPDGTRGAHQPGTGGTVGRWMQKRIMNRIRRKGKMIGLGFDALVLTTIGRKSGAERALLHLARRCGWRVAKWSRFPSRRLPEVLKAVNLGIADGVQGLWWRTPV